MAKTKAQGESVMAYFRRLFQENSDLLDHGNNDEIIAAWERDHPGQTMDQKVKQSMANTKSIMRKKLGKVKRRKRRKGKGTAAVAAAAPKAPRVRSSAAVLEKLEGMIDDCLSVARGQDNSGLDGAIKHLLVARREVAWEMGQPNSK